MATLREAAHEWISAGFSVIPVRADGTKRPLFEWARFQKERATTAHLDLWLDGNPGIGIGLVCGAVSGNLEMLELEGRACDYLSLSAVERECETRGVLDLWNSFHNDGYSEVTPSGGMHLLYRIADHEVPGNTKVARRPATEEELADKPKDKIKVLAETRGEGGYLVVAPSGGRVHPTGLDWRMVAGQFGRVPTITWEQRNQLHEAISIALDQMPERDIPAPPVQPRSMPTNGSLRPGDEFNERADWNDNDLLGGAGWTISHTLGGVTYWVKPGSSLRNGHHATTGRDGHGANDRLYVFSTATEFDTETPLSKFHVYATLHHGGDYAAATKALVALGYGEPLKPKVESLTEFTYEPSATASSGVVADPPLPRNAKPRYERTSVGNAERMVSEYSKDFRFVPQTKEWMAWDGTRWAVDYGQAQVTAATTAMTYKLFDEAHALLAADDKDVAGKALYKWAHSSQMDNGMNGTIKQFSRRSEVVATPGDFDNRTGFINLPNGVLDLRERKLLPHSRAYMMTQMFGTAYNADATCPRFEQFMETVLPDPKMRAFVQRAVGYSLLGRPDQRAMFIVHGPARTGKSQFLNIMSALFGDYGDTAMAGSFHKVDKKGDAASPGLHALRNKRFVSASEESEHAVLDTESLKRLTGNEAITTRALYQDGQRWKPQMVLWIATNPLPQLNSDDNAIWDRVKPIPFTTRFSARGEGDTIKETPGIAESIFSEEAAGILNWALSGLAEFFEIGGLDQPEQVDQGVADYRHETDPVSQYVAEVKETGQLKEQSGDRAPAKLIYMAHVEWCRESNTHPISARRFHRRLRMILGIDDYTQSNGAYYLDGWVWVPVNGVMGTMWR